MADKSKYNWDHIQELLDRYYTGCIGVYAKNDTCVVEDYIYNYNDYTSY